jgi:hypothetical protein
MLRPTLAASVLFLTGALASVPACNGSSGSGGSASDYCSAVAGYVSKCHITDPCTTAAVEDCSTIASVYSAAQLAAAVSCVSDAVCGDAGVTSVGSCIQQKQMVATPTATQSKLAQDYCAICPRANQTEAACVSGFYAPSAPSEAGIPAVGPGNGFFGLSDSVASDIDTQCIAKITADAGAFGCAFTFDSCALQLALAAIGKAGLVCTPDAAPPGPVTDGG